MDDFTEFVLSAYEKGKETPYLPKDPFIAFGFDGNPFSETSIQDIKKAKLLKPRIGKVATMIGQLINSQEQGDLLDAFIIGASHNGISTLISSLVHLLKTSNDELSNLILLDAKQLVEFEDNKYLPTASIQNFRKEIAISETMDNTPILIIDHGDYLVDFFVSFRQSIEYQFPDLPILFILTPTAWVRLKSHVVYADYDLFNHSLPALYLEPLENEEIKTLLKIKLSNRDKILHPFTEEVIESIAYGANKSLKNAIRMCNKICEECYFNGLDYSNRRMVEDIRVLFKYTLIDEFMEIVSKDDNSRNFILTLLAMRSIALDLGITYEDLIENMNLQKTTIAYHLSQLSDKDIIHKRTINRKAYYRINDSLRTLTDTILMPIFESKERHVYLQGISDHK